MITSRCTECGAESSGSGGIVHTTTCTATLLKGGVGYGMRPPATQITFDTPEEQAKFWAGLKGTHGGNDMAAPEPLANTEPDESAQGTIEDKLYIRSKLFVTIEEAMFNYPDKFYIDRALDKLQAIITTETTKARIDEIVKIVDFGKTVDDQWNAHFKERLAALQKEQK